MGERGVGALVALLPQMQSLSSLNLSHCPMSADMLKSLFDYFQETGFCPKEIDMSCNELGDDSAVVISEFLASNMMVHRLILQKNAFSNKGAAAILRGLRANHHTISLGGGKIGTKNHDCVKEIDGVLLRNREAIELAALEKEISELG